MPSRALALPVVLVAAVACGSTTIVEGDPDDTTSASSTTGATTGGSGGSGGQPGTTGAGAAGGVSAGGGPSDGPWRADMWIGQVDHMSLRHHAVEADVCLLLTATAPSGGSAYDVSMPEPWALDQIAAWDDTAGCMADPFTPAGEPVAAAGGLGAITFDLPPMQYYPCELDVDIEASFENGPAWLPETLWLKASMLEVGGACD